MTRSSIASIALIVIVLVTLLWLSRDRLMRGSSRQQASEKPAAAVSGGATSALFTSRAIGDPPKGEERPQIAHVAIVDLDRDGLNDILVCDSFRNIVTWIRQAPRGTFSESVIAGVSAPAHVEAIDFDRDGDLDLVVAAPLPVTQQQSGRLGDRHGERRSTEVPISLHCRSRGASCRRASGRSRWRRRSRCQCSRLRLRRRRDQLVGESGRLEVRAARPSQLSGPINAIPADINGDKLLDVVALVSQEWEEIWAFINNGKGTLTPRMLWGSTNPDFGSSWMTLVDMDRDGDSDVLYANGDAFEYAPPNSRPWQGVQWLENDGKMQFTMHPIASSPTHLLTLAVGDLDGDGKPDAVTGGMHISRPYDRIGRITAWFTQR